MKLTKKQIEEIIRLRKEGTKRVELSKMFNVSIYTISWHTDERHRKRIKEYQKKWYQNMSKEEKSKYFNRKKEYQKNYHKNRYTNDKEFRKKQIEQSKECNKKNYKKKGVKKNG